MNDTKIYVIALEQITRIQVGELMKLDIKHLRELELLADLAVLKAAEQLDLYSALTSGRLIASDFTDMEIKADKALYDAGTVLEWIKGAINTKLHIEGLGNASDA
jgi:hypothetical protein